MAQSTISIRVDDSLKRNFDSLCESIGLTYTSAINVFMKAAVREQRIPFELKAESDSDVRMKAIDAFASMRAQVAATGMSDPSIDEINAMIKKVRDERRK